MALFDLEGNLIPPGAMLVGEVQDASVSGGLDLASSEEMFMVGTSDPWVVWRVLPDGTSLDPRQGRPINFSTARLTDLLWAGRDFWWFSTDWRNDLPMRHRVICSLCSENQDRVSARACEDCDDTDASVNPQRWEACRGWKDEDCDGAVDCDDAECAPGGGPPGEVTDLRWSGGELVWSAVAGAERCDLARGLLGDLRRRGDLLQAECAGVELDATSWVDDGRKPPEGEALWYLVRAEGEPCALGSWGAGREVNACR